MYREMTCMLSGIFKLQQVTGKIEIKPVVCFIKVYASAGKVHLMFSFL